MADEHEQARQRDTGRDIANQPNGQSHQGESWADKYRSRFAAGARRRFSPTGGPGWRREDDQLTRGVSLRGRGAEDYERWDDRLREIHKQLRIARSAAREQDCSFQPGREEDGGTKPRKR